MGTALKAFGILAFIALGIFALVANRPSDADIIAVVESQGYTNVAVGGPDVWACGEDDEYSREFTAVGMNGLPVLGVVCSGINKGATVRIKRAG